MLENIYLDIVLLLVNLVNILLAIVLILVNLLNILLAVVMPFVNAGEYFDGFFVAISECWRIFCLLLSGHW